MNKKGVTLVELIAVIAILGLFGVMVGPAILSIRTTVLTSSLDSKINQIETAAVEYASDNIMDIPSISEAQESCNRSCIEGAGSLLNAPQTCDSYVCKDHCLIVSVKTLISRGYITGDNDEKDVLLNPLSDVPLNDSDVCITFNSANAIERKVVTYVINKSNLY